MRITKIKIKKNAIYRYMRLCKQQRDKPQCEVKFRIARSIYCAKLIHTCDNGDLIFRYYDLNFRCRLDEDVLLVINVYRDWLNEKYEVDPIKKERYISAKFCVTI